MRNPVAKIGFAVALCVLVVAAALAQVQATRTTSFDWQCQDANGNRISDHQREGTAIIACLNAVNGAYVQGGRYRINRGTQPTAGTATLSWTPPTTNVDGTSLTNLAGYRISYGANSTELTQAIQVANPAVVRYTLNLSPGEYFFAVRAYTSNGTESALSNVISKVVL